MDVRARLGRMAPGEEYTLLCEEKMARSMEQVVPDAGGTIVMRQVRSYAVVLTVRRTG